MPRSYLIVSGLVLYIISLFLPAFWEFTGYETAAIALSVLFEDASTYHLLTLLHMFFLGIHNFLLIGVLFRVRSLLDGRTRWLLWAFLVSTLNVAGFFIFSAFEEAIGDLQIGYYLWLLASLLILGGIVWKQPVIALK